MKTGYEYQEEAEPTGHPRILVLVTLLAGSQVLHQPWILHHHVWFIIRGTSYSSFPEIGPA